VPFTRFLDGRPPHTTPHKTTHTTIKIRSGSTHTGELDAAVTALGSGTLLLQVKVPELTTRSLDDANLVGPCVVPVKRENSSICRSKTIQSCISSILIVANIDSSEEEALCEMREFFFCQRTGSGGAGGWKSQSVFSIETISSQARQLTYCSLLFGILACLNLCYGQERRLSFVGL
jgi:hypothetical protein